MLHFIKKFIPKKLFRALQPIYHYKLAFLGAILYRFPARKLTVIAITGTKGKSTTAQLVTSILEAAGKKVAMVSTVQFKIAGKITPNTFKMTTPGRFFLQKFLRQAVTAGCTHAVLEVSSEAAKQYRHKFLNLDAFVFLNLSPEHIESHGGYDKYVAAKLSIAGELEKSSKPKTVLVVNGEDPEHQKFLAYKATEKRSFHLKNATPYTLNNMQHVSFTWKGIGISTKLRGMFNLYNMLAAATVTDALGIDTHSIKKGLESVSGVAGRVESIKAGQPFEVIVDYAHTADSLMKLYETFKNKNIIALLGNTGGGRDTWKRPEMAKVADTYAKYIILANEDPYDEDPQKIIDDMIPGITKVPYEVDLDRRSAIKKAIIKAQEIPNSIVLITGKGTDPYIMGPNNTKTPWSDAAVAREELEKIYRK